MRRRRLRTPGASGNEIWKSNVWRVDTGVGANPPYPPLGGRRLPAICPSTGPSQVQRLSPWSALPRVPLVARLTAPPRPPRRQSAQPVHLGSHLISRLCVPRVYVEGTEGGVHPASSFPSAIRGCEALTAEKRACTKQRSRIGFRAPLRPGTRISKSPFGGTC